MPKSRTRTRKPAALRGIPAAILAKAPGNLAPAERAEWCRHYLDGAADRPYRRPRQTRGHGLGDWSHRAYRLGVSERSSVAKGTLDDMDSARHRADARAGRDTAMRIAGIERRLDAITGMTPEMRELGDDLARRILPGILPLIIR